MSKKETGFDVLARLIKQESEDVRGQIIQLEYKVDSGFASIRNETKSSRIDINELQRKVEVHEGYAKEIDHVLQRTAKIEQRLGIKPPTYKK